MSVYVDNAKVVADLTAWKMELKENPNKKMPDSVGQAILSVAYGFTDYYRFRKYTDNWRDSMITEAIENLVRKIHLFDESKYGNIHAYMTMITARAFFRVIKKEKKKEATKNKYFVECVYDSEDADMNELVDPDFYMDIVKKLDDYESSIKKPEKKDKSEYALAWLFEDENSKDEDEDEYDEVMDELGYDFDEFDDEDLEEEDEEI